MLPITKHFPLTISSDPNSIHSENSDSTAQHSLLVCSKEGKSYRKLYLGEGWGEHSEVL